jgi:hypothetical protein
MRCVMYVVKRPEMAGILVVICEEIVYCKFAYMCINVVISYESRQTVLTVYMEEIIRGKVIK